jgi:hypothetical protein
MRLKPTFLCSIYYSLDNLNWVPSGSNGLHIYTTRFSDMIGSWVTLIIG